MHAAVAVGDADALKLAAHTLKSSSANVGAQVLSARCREIERLARAANVAAAADLVAGTDAEFWREQAELIAERVEGQAAIAMSAAAFTWLARSRSASTACPVRPYDALIKGGLGNPVSRQRQQLHFLQRLRPLFDLRYMGSKVLKSSPEDPIQLYFPLAERRAQREMLFLSCFPDSFLLDDV